MTDFAAIRERNRIRSEELKKNTPATVIKPREVDYLTRINHLITYHLGEMSAWEEQFCYSNKEFMLSTEAVKNGKAEDLVHILTERVKSKIAELEAQFCNATCHALMKAGIPHA